MILVCSEIVDEAYSWREGTQISGESSNPPADTLAPIYGSEKIGYVIWNDEPSITHCPGGCTSFVLGHSKGEQKACFKTCACVLSAAFRILHAIVKDHVLNLALARLNSVNHLQYIQIVL